MDANHEWQALSAQWQRQETPAIDLAALAAEVRRRGRRLRLAVWAEFAATVLMLALSAWIIAQPRTTPLETGVFALIALVLVCYQAAVLWVRRRELGDGGLDPASLLDLEIRRSRTTLRYWRLSAWTGVGLWVALYAVVMWELLHALGGDRAAGMAVGLGINIVLMPLACAFAWWRCRGVRRLLARLEALRAQLRAG